MAKQLLNEAERFLVKQWDESRLLELSMESVRKKYAELWERTAEAVEEAHPELDHCKVRVTQLWASGFCVFSRKVWPGTKNETWPPGLWLDQLRLEKLSAEDAPPPSATIWIPAKLIKQIGLDTNAARAELLNAAKEILSGDELDEVLRAGNGNSDQQTLLSFTSPTKAELIGALAEGDGQRFVEIIVSRFDLMARFVPALDKILDRHHAEKRPLRDLQS